MIINNDLSMTGDDVILAVGAPTHTSSSPVETHYQAGQVLLFSFSDLLNQNAPTTSINNFHTQSRFGFSLIVEDINGDNVEDLVVGDPLRSELWPVTDPVEFGSTYGFFGGSTFPTSDVDSVSADWCVNSMVNHMRYRSFVIAGDLNGDGKNDLVSSGPRFSPENSTWSGFVSVEFSS